MSVTAVFKLGGMGDLLMATPALRAYRKSFPGERIVFIVGRSNAAVMAGNPHLDELAVVDDAALFRGPPWRQARETLRLIGLLRRMRAERVFVLHRDWRWNLVARLAGVRERYGFARDLRGLFLSRAAVTSEQEHETAKYQRVFGLRAGYRPDGVAMDLLPQPNPPRLPPEFARLDAGSGAWVALSPGGASNVKEDMDTRRWPLEQYRALCALVLEQTACRILLVGAERDVPLTRQLDLDPERTLDLAGKTDPAGTAEALRRCALLVTHDSGPMHLGAAAGIPVIGLFGPTRPEEKVPITHPLSRFLWRGAELACSPCYRDGVLPPCSHPHYKFCIVSLTPAEVFGHVREILRARS
jgi:ADP-heptose:LPS heptosyltransferase